MGQDEGTYLTVLFFTDCGKIFAVISFLPSSVRSFRLLAC